MVSPFGVSVGDFIASIELVRGIAQALKESTGSSSRFVGLIKELYGLQRALLQVNGLTVPPEREPELAAIKQAAAQCQGTIEAFLAKNKKFFTTLREGGSHNRLRDSLHKIEWQLFRKDDVEAFQVAISGHTASISLLLLPFLVCVSPFFSS
jgi:hypothetical protein